MSEDTMDDLWRWEFYSEPEDLECEICGYKLESEDDFDLENGPGYCPCCQSYMN